jgi:hypothetical protein
VTKQALLVGINDYQGISDLRGCINDVINMRNILKNHSLLNTSAIASGYPKTRSLLSNRRWNSLEQIELTKGRSQLLETGERRSQFLKTG